MKSILARALEKVDDAEQRKETVDAELKGEIKAHAQQASVLAAKLRNGYEYRYIDCQESHDYDTGQVRTLRIDTGELVLERAMTPEERQVGFAFKVPAEQ